ncbi:hypothetical protein SK128_000220 [Halocaridina rubra]|uniref:p53 DNA-binding domain-containing protein n=1 Tax=Halocaridina rubra TaxID=373956 RepID=A0AAN8WUR6_HALRR
MDDQDSEPLFGQDVYSLLRDDSLLHRTGSNNFATLLESADASLPNANNPVHREGYGNPQANSEHDQQHRKQVQHSQLPQQGNQSSQPTMIKLEVDQQNENATPNQQPQHHYIYQMNTNGELVLIGSDSMPEPTGAEAGAAGTSQQQQQQTTIPWDDIDNDSMNLNSNPIRHNSLMALIEESASLAMPDTTGVSRTLPSLQPWSGKYNFDISLPTGNKDRNKWCYSQMLQKLYVCPNVAVPVNISLSKWIDASITITPVFQQSQHRTDPVTRCYNCRSIQNCEPSLLDYIVQIEGEGCDYELIQERHIVKVPLQSPPPGEVSSTLLVKLMCLTSCVGGPNRRPFCLVLTLRSNPFGEEIGRQIIDVKCCKCPSRDMNNDEKGSSSYSNFGQASGEEKMTKIRKLSLEIQVKQRRKKPKIKQESGRESRYVNIAVPVEFELQVKSYVNGLIAEQFVRRNQPHLLPFPEDEC